MILVAGFLSGILLIVLGSIISHFEEAALDREFYARWGEDRRPDHPIHPRAQLNRRCARCRNELNWRGECLYCRFWTPPA